uniref:Tyrosine-protein phosphatase domain-containing protein n=1 Tax=Heterorhabditis bacteriophora TaxID=37862 RepID=A0A1I7WAQ8_HETBA
MAIKIIFIIIYISILANCFYVFTNTCSVLFKLFLSFPLQDVVCLDETRVKLTMDVPPSTDYIHANWVKFERHDRAFIAAQIIMEGQYVFVVFSVLDYIRVKIPKHKEKVHKFMEDFKMAQLNSA